MWFFTHVWIMPALMATSFVLILFFGKRLPFKGAEVGITAVALCLAFAGATAFNWFSWSADGPKLAESAPAAQREAAEVGALGEVPGHCSNVVTGLRSSESAGESTAGGTEAPSGEAPSGQAPAGEGAAPATGTGIGESASAAGA